MLGERPLSKQARELLARERGRTEDDALKARVMERAQTVLQLDRPSGVGLRLVAESVGDGPQRRAPRVLPLIAAALSIAGLAAAGAYSWTISGDARPAPKSSTPAPAPAPVPRIVSNRGQEPSPPADDAQLEAPPEPRVRAIAPTGDAARAVNPKQYASELALLEPARSSIGRGDYAAALTALGQHRREFPNGQLSQEREALRVRALWGLGQKPAARAAADAFRKRYPRSTLLSWLKDQGDQKP